ncbi:MAG: hypothetical protein ACK41U_10450 [Paracoccus sp. (in: a-proteobacteria)]|uniref:hypothetical protein n=1 Tax=Paracoccus sp. TaxID=267 RepID=UPI00391D9EE5
MHHPAGGVGAHVLPIFHIRHRPSPASARWASHSVPAHLSARGLAVPVWAALLLPASLLCIAAHPLGLAVLLGGDLSGGLAALLLAGYAAALALHVAAARLAGLPLWLALLLPAYWLALGAALLLALRDLARDPAHWRNTEHGAAPGRNTLCQKHESPQQSARTPAE